MAETIREAIFLVERGHIRVGFLQVTGENKH